VKILPLYTRTIKYNLKRTFPVAIYLVNMGVRRKTWIMAPLYASSIGLICVSEKILSFLLSFSLSSSSSSSSAFVLSPLACFPAELIWIYGSYRELVGLVVTIGF
jgi:hypothetical protein